MPEHSEATGQRALPAGEATGIFDTHAHYTDKRFAPDRDALLKALPGRGVALALTCGSSLPDSRRALAIAGEYAFVYTACGIHPHEASGVRGQELGELRALLAHEKCVAAGEIGLDYHYDFSPREAQRDLFRRQLELALELGMPVVVHDREAHEDTLKILQEYARPLTPASSPLTPVRGVVHCFSGSLEFAREILALGLYIGLGGAVTFRNAKKPLEVAANIPLKRLLLETDAPYMAPEPHLGKRCDSAHIAYTAQKIAGLRGMGAQELIGTCNVNGRALFGIIDTEG
jgi:TatD DNase family protein